MLLPPAAFGLSHRGLARFNAQEVAVAIIMHANSVAYRSRNFEGFPQTIMQHTSVTVIFDLHCGIETADQINRVG